jgi:hypothetical protein
LATSGTYNTTFNVDDVIRRACLRLRIPSAAITAELAQTAKDDLWLFMQTVVRSGIPLWTVEPIIVPLYLGIPAYTLPSTVVDKVSDPVRRKVNRADDYLQATTSAGGDLENAFDGELTNAFTQTSPLGWVSYDFDSPTALSMIGYLPAATSATLTLTVEFSDDASTWTQALAPFLANAVVNEWVMADVTNNSSHQYWRIRATVGTLNAYQLLFGWNPSDIQMGALNRDDYLNMPNKIFQGDPLSYFYERLRDAPKITLWPVPNDSFTSMVVYVRRKLQDVGALTDTLDFPDRWLEPVIDNLAVRLTESGVQHGLDPGALQKLTSNAALGLKQAMGTEEDHLPIRIQPNLRRYTR